MPESDRELTATRIALLELKDEQRLIREGYELLDEKRILLAAEIRRHLAQLRAVREAYRKLENAARDRLMAAVGRHGLDELSTYPTLSLTQHALQLRRSRLLGLERVSAQFVAPSTTPPENEQPVNPSPEARSCALAHRQWLEQAVALAACSVNLRRLLREYVRTERRARAIENVLLPEVEAAMAFIDEQLTEVDQEEVARLRLRRGAAL